MEHISTLNDTTSSPAKVLSLMIRTAVEPNSPSLITDWLEIDQCDLTSSLHDQREHYKKQFHLLLDTIYDELLPHQWRCCCLDQIYRPMQALNRISKSSENLSDINKLFYELNVTCNYLKAGLVTSTVTT